MEQKDAFNVAKALTGSESLPQKMVSTPILLHLASASIPYMAKELGYGFKDFINYYKEEYGGMIYFKDDIDRLCKEFLGRCEEKGYVEGLWKRYRELVKKVRRLDCDGVEDLETDELIAGYDEYWKALYPTIGVCHIIEAFSMGCDRKILDNIKDLDADVVMRICEKSWIYQEEEELDALKKSPKTLWESLLGAHAHKYRWMNNCYTGAKHLGVEHFRERMKQLEFVASDFDALRREKADAMKGLDPETRKLVSIAHGLTLWQDERKKDIMISLETLDRYLGEIAKRFGIDHDLIRYMVPGEITKEKLEKVTNSVLEFRREGIVILSNIDGEYIFTGKEALEIISVFESDDNKEEELLGMSASSGNVRGPVKVCCSVEDIAAVKEGDVLVASMTRPEFLPAMRKAVAFVTDEGGITCHAAIVAREMGKPCVIGTRNATLVLKDGDMVEVDADRGIIKRI